MLVRLKPAIKRNMLASTRLPRLICPVPFCSTKEFKKVWKYDSMLHWAQKFLEVVQTIKESVSAQSEVDLLLRELMDTEDEMAHVVKCLDDLEVFGYDKLKEQQEQISAVVARIEGDNKIKVIERQLRYTQFNTSYFGLINQFKKKSVENQKH